MVYEEVYRLEFVVWSCCRALICKTVNDLCLLQKINAITQLDLKGRLRSPELQPITHKLQTMHLTGHITIASKKPRTINSKPQTPNHHFDTPYLFCIFEAQNHKLLLS
jgi:hypothetical protein